MRTFHLLDEQGTTAGRMILDDCGNGHVVLDCLPKPLAVVERQPGEPWRSKISDYPPGGRGSPRRGIILPVSPRVVKTLNFKNFPTSTKRGTCDGEESKHHRGDQGAVATDS